MKVTIDNEFTTIARKKDAEHEAQTFAERYTENDLVRMFNENFVPEWQNPLYGEEKQIYVQTSCSDFIEPFVYQHRVEIYIYDKHYRFEHAIFYMTQKDGDIAISNDTFRRYPYERKENNND